MIRLIVESLRNLLSAKQRTLLALIGIVIGTGSVIAMICVGGMAREQALRQFKEMGTDLLGISFMGDPSNSLAAADVSAFRTRIPGIVESAPIISGGASMYLRGQSVDGRVIGSTDGLFQLGRVKLAEGRGISPFDTLEPFIVLGSRVGQSLNPPPQIGDQLRIGSSLVTVIGILAPTPFNPILGIDFNSSILMSPQNAIRLAQGQLSNAAVRFGPSLRIDTATQALQRHVAGLRPGMMLRVSSPEQIIATMERQMATFGLLLAAIGSISLVVGGVGVMNVMLVSVTERKKEIGIRMAIGARPGSIRGMFLVEALVLSIIGGVLGTAVGIGAAAVIGSYSGWPFLLEPIAVPVGAGISALVGIFFGFWPAVQASRLDPIDALRAE